MQWPPRPGPGLKLMKPNGLVAAASATSQTSMPMRSQSIAISFMSAMLTERKMFSSSLVSSAASGEETRHERVDGRRVDRRRALGAGRREAADDLRRRAHRVVGAARVDALGRHGEVEVAARLEARGAPGSAAAPRASCRDRSSTRARSRLPAAQVRRDATRVAASTYVRSGSRFVGQRRRHADDHRRGRADDARVGGAGQPRRNSLT